ncbi:glycine zipper domain-containing protein [Achromobacter anxifer]|jgi:ElaB/YqjD/DUF883 family membrane-anchored ribosome-binding protein|nr:hypothetical protein [Achromobacter anxifer]MDF8365249.1 hypothetical protein [Achromobacter anxifer]
MSSAQSPGEHAGSNHSQAVQNAAAQEQGMLQRLVDSAVHRSETIGSKAQNALDNFREIEQNAAARLQASGQHAQQFVHEKPWVAIAAVAVAAFALGTLARIRR